MKSLNITLEWPEFVHIKDLRKFIIDQISKKEDGELIRWSINDINFLTGNDKEKIIKINAIFLY